MCRAYSKLCRNSKPGRLLYRIVAEPVMDHSPSLEHEVAYSASTELLPYTNLMCRRMEAIRRIIKESDVCIMGPVPDGRCPENYVTIAVEGAFVSRPSEASRSDVVVGDMDSLPAANLMNTCGVDNRICLLHIHSDNYPLVKRHLGPLSSSNVVFTSQTSCFFPVWGIGGYTDGDRALLLAMMEGARRIMVIGFDFRRPYTEHKLYGSIDTKMRKLRIAEVILHLGMLLYNYRLSRWNEGIIELVQV